MTRWESVKTYTPHPTPHTLSPQKTFSADPNQSTANPPLRQLNGG
ncbi:hypothetical protein O53_3697 [Microcystis aeruginosa TAIHU98]|uniref:Uncharacterized protein n=1 Tax=Microcystis aeruginosa TAIHU98 TaxID=1134457 RepID=L7E9B2_MICAE|nr:hypothetical protein O53_3697 [Microcystis aeruginosa TAIHU98]